VEVSRRENMPSRPRFSVSHSRDVQSNAKTTLPHGLARDSLVKDVNRVSSRLTSRITEVRTENCDRDLHVPRDNSDEDKPRAQPRAQYERPIHAQKTP